MMLFTSQEKEWIFLPNKMCIFGADCPFFFVERTRSPDSDEFIRILQSNVSSGSNPTWKNLRYSSKINKFIIRFKYRITYFK